jgi:hypothetical protein
VRKEESVMKKPTKKQTEMDRARVNKSFNRVCNGVQINIMHLSKFMDAGLLAIHEGRSLNTEVTDETLDKVLKVVLHNYVETNS